MNSNTSIYLVFRCNTCPVGWGCTIHRLHLCKGLRPLFILNECPGYEIKQSDYDVPVMLEQWGMRSTTPLLSLPAAVVAPDRDLLYGINRTKLRTYGKLNHLK